MTDENSKKLPGLRAGIALDDKGQHVSVLIEDNQSVEAAVNATQARARLREQGIYTEDRFGTGGQHVARDLQGKTGWRDGSMPNPGPNPEKNRNFLGDEFNGIIGYDKSGKPAFWSHWDDVKSVADLEGKTIKICLADKFPDKLKGNPSIERTDDAWGTDAAGKTNKPEDVAQKVHPRYEEQIRKFAAESANSGVKIELVDNPDDAHITVMAWQRNLPPRLLGFASFPESMNSWASLRGLGQPRGKGFVFLSNDYANDLSVSDAELQHVFVHESALGHNMGMCHPHDLARLNITQQEALASTVMAYSDMHAQKIAGKEGSDVGALDYSFRNWVPNPPAINAGNGGVYDIQAHLDETYARDKGSMGYMRSRLLPTAAIVDHGVATELHGTKTGNDLIDTNRGYASIVTAPDGRGKQKFLLAEGHISLVKGLGGDNTIIASETGDQRIEPGVGNNTIAFYYQGVGGNKFIVTEGPGTDTLVLSENILNAHPDLAVKKDRKGFMVIGEGKDQIKIAGKGIDSIRVIDALGATVLEKEVKGLSAQDINDQVFVEARNELNARQVDDNHGFAARLTEERSARVAGGRGA